MKKTFSHSIQNEQITFKHALGTSDKSGKEFHTYHEIIWFRGGKARFISENMQTDLQPDTLIVIPSETYHQLLITGSQEDYHRCVFQFETTPAFAPLIALTMNRILLSDMTKEHLYLFRQMLSLTEPSEEVLQDQNTSKEIEPDNNLHSRVMESVLTLLLNSLRNHNSKGSAMDTDLLEQKAETLSEKCVNYINTHPADTLSVEQLAKALNVSASYLSHAFKNQMNISVHQYILKRRLISARHKIMEGEPTIKAALDCGFNDYSGFYRQYKKMFGASPSHKV